MKIQNKNLLFNKRINHLIDFFLLTSSATKVALENLCFLAFHMNQSWPIKLPFESEGVWLQRWVIKDSAIFILFSWTIFFQREPAAMPWVTLKQIHRHTLDRNWGFPPSANIVNDHLSVIRESLLGKRSSSLRKDLW